ncbi:pyruvate, water dikinase regulatory protein [Peptoniphilaceae bacterium SGI.131]
MINLYVISDSTGETGIQYANALMIQFPTTVFNRHRFSNVTSEEKIRDILSKLLSNSVILITVVKEDILKIIHDFCREKNIPLIDLLGGPISILEEVTGERAVRLPGLMRDLDSDYFDKMEAIEFAMNFDDGKSPRGLLKADIVLLGVSRTSKTPLSIFLANKKYKVANLPLVPEANLPDEIFKVDKNKIIGLIINPDQLNEIRNQRLQALGLNPQSGYANRQRIEEELNYAKSVFKQLDCKVINVTGSTIEETAAMIQDLIG